MTSGFAGLRRRDRLDYRIMRLLGALPGRVRVLLSGRPAVRIDGQTLDPTTQLMLSLSVRRGDAPYETLPVAKARAALHRQVVSIGGPPVPIGAVRDLTIEGAAGPLRARCYGPQEPGGPHPLLLYFHGGGFVLGDLDTHDNLCRMLARHAGVNVLSVDYRLAPEHPFPAAVEDAQAALRWAFENASDLGADPGKIAVGGDSAGGNLAAVLTLLAAGGGGPSPVIQLLIYPVTDATASLPSRELFARGLYLTDTLIEWYRVNYAGAPGMDVTDPRVSPLFAEDLSGLAPALVVTAGFDPLRDEGEAYAAALRAAGTTVALRRFPEHIHGFLNTAQINRASRDGLIEVAGATRAMLASVPSAEPRTAARGEQGAVV
jgi:acetyl esterase